ncbi:hypothetical protein TNCV_33351 [Trichonephila clavipes]|nr:hypothetical protein TNCV_33351 [Trichonephila clavipes]
MSKGMRLQIVWPGRAAIKIPRKVDALLFQKLLHESNKVSVPLGGRPPVHEWYEGNSPGAALFGTSSRRDETTLAGFGSGHTRAQRHVAGLKV